MGNGSRIDYANYLTGGILMIVNFPKTNVSEVKEHDLIAVTADQKFIGYGEVLAVLDEYIMVSFDSRTSKFFNNVFYEGIECDIQLF